MSIFDEHCHAYMFLVYILLYLKLLGIFRSNFVIQVSLVLRYFGTPRGFGTVDYIVYFIFWSLMILFKGRLCGFLPPHLHHVRLVLLDDCLYSARLDGLKSCASGSSREIAAFWFKCIHFVRNISTYWSEQASSTRNIILIVIKTDFRKWTQTHIVCSWGQFLPYKP